MHGPVNQFTRLTRVVAGGLAAVCLGFVGFVALIYLKQHSMVYICPYDTSYAHALPEGGEEIFYSLPLESRRFLCGRPKRQAIARSAVGCILRQCFARARLDNISLDERLSLNGWPRFFQRRA